MTTSASVTMPSGEPGSSIRKPDVLDKVREEFAKLLRERIAERENELRGLRAQLAAVANGSTSRTPQACSACGKPGHSKRTCPERDK